MNKNLPNDLLYPYRLETTNQVAFYTEYPTICKKQDYLKSEFQQIRTAYVKQRGAM